MYPFSSENFSLHDIPSGKGETLSAFLIQHPKAKFTIIFSHGNATDIGYMRDYLIELSHVVQVNILAYDYTGYGRNRGEPSVQSTCRDIEAVLDYTRDVLNIPSSTIVLYGQSLGSGPSTRLASKAHEIAGLILHSPLMSGLRVIKSLPFTWWFDIFPNVDWIRKVRCPVLIIHGTKDAEIPLVHGITLFERSNKLYQP